MAEPHICKINPWNEGDHGEWVSVWNDGSTPVALTGLELSDYTLTQQHVHIYRFPSYSDGSPISLNAREVAFVFTGPGNNEWKARPDGRRELWLFVGRHAPIWNNSGDVAYLRNRLGEFVSTLIVGHPPRHPNGH